MNKNQTWRRVLSLLCAMVMLVGIMVVGSVVASAAETEYVAYIGEQGYDSLASAVAACTDSGDYLITMSKSDNTSFTFTKKNGVNITIDGQGNTYGGTITFTAEESYTNQVTVFKNVVFKTGNESCILINKSTVSNVTFDGCTFNGSTKYSMNFGSSQYPKNFKFTNKCVVDMTGNLWQATCNVEGLVVEDMIIKNVDTAFKFNNGNPKFENVEIENAYIFLYLANSSEAGIYVDVCNTEFNGCYFAVRQDSSATKSNYNVYLRGENTITVQPDSGRPGFLYDMENYAGCCYIDVAGYRYNPNYTFTMTTVPYYGIIDGTLYEDADAFAKALMDLGGKHEVHSHNIVLGQDCDVDFDIGEHRETGDELAANVTLDLNGHKYTGEIILHNQSTLKVEGLTADDDIQVVECDPELTKVHHNEVNHWIATRHNITFVTTPPTCTKDGYTTYSCSNANCDYSYVESVVPALGHSYVEHTIDPTCTEPGGIHDHCTVCDKQVIKVRYPAAHAWSTEGVYTDPTFEADGFTTYTCTRDDCGATKVVTDEGTKLAALVINSTTGKEYGSLTAALKEVANGNTLVLNGNVNENVTISKSITLDGANGVGGRYEYTGTMTVAAGITLHVQNVKFVNGGINKSTRDTSGDYHVYNCQFYNNGTYDYAMCFQGANLIDVKGCYVYDYKYGGLYVVSSTVTLKVEGFEVVDCYSYAIALSSGVNNATIIDLSVTNAYYGVAIDNTDNRYINLSGITMENVSLAIGDSGKACAINCNLSGTNDFGTAALSAYAKLVLTDATATLKANAGLNVKTNVAGSCVAYNGVYSVFAHAGTAVKENEVLGNCVTDTTYDSVVYCSNCGIEVSRTEVVESATGAHDPKAAVEENRVPAQFDIPGSYDLVVYCNVCGAELSRAPQTIPALVAVASINGERFTTLQAAVTAATDGDTIVVLKDVDLGTTAVLISGKAITLDLNGKTITGSGDAVIQLAGTLTVLDSSAEKNGALQSTGSKSCVTLSGGTLTVESGSIISVNTKGIQLGGSNKTNKVTINGGYIYGSEGALNVNKGSNTVSITGGKLEGTNAVHVADGNGQVVAKFEITGGEFDGKMPAYNSITAGKLLITGGKFSVDVKALCAEGYCVAKKADGSYVVGVENFDNGVYTDPTFEADGFTTYTCEHCGYTYTVTDEGSKLVAVVSINGVPYASLAEAVSAVPNGETATIKVLKDYTESYFRTSGNFALGVWIGNNKNITIDFDGHTVTFDARAYTTQDTYTLFYVASAGASLTLTGNGTIRDDHGSDLRINVVWAQSGVITNENCNFYIDDATAGSDLFYVNNGGTIYINGGKHEFTNSYINSLNSKPGIVIVSGGSFKKDIVAETQEGEVQLADGYCISKVNSDGFYTVQLEQFDAGVKTPATFEKNAYMTYTCSYCGEKKVVELEGTMLVGVATVNGNPYTSLKAAHTAANAGDTIVLVADVVLAEDFVISKNITFDGNGHQLTGTIKISALAVVIKNVNFYKGYINQEANAADYATLEVLNCTFANGGYAITTAHLDELTIKECTVTDQSLLYARLSTLNIYVANTTVARGNYGAYICYADHNIVFENVTMTDMNHFGIMTQNYGAKTVTIKNCSIDAPIPFATQPVKENIRDNFVFVGDNKVANIAVNMYNEYCNFKLASGTIDMPNAVVVDSADSNKTAVYNTGKYILIDKVTILNSYLVLGNTIDARFEIENVNSQMTVTVNFAGKTYTLTVEDAAKAGGAYAFNGVIVAKQMTEAITVTVTYLDGTVLDTETFTVREYAEAIISGDYSAAARNLAMALLNYGAAAQNAFVGNVSDDDLANGGTDYDVYKATANDGVVNGYNDPDNSYYGASLNLNNGINFNFKFFADMVEGFDYVIVTDLNGNKIVRYEADSEKIGDDFKNLRDLVVIPVDLSGADANQSLVCTFYKKATVEGEADTILTYAGDSVLGYCARALEKAPDTGAFSKKFYQTLANYVVAVRYYELNQLPTVDTEGESENV